MKTNIKESQRVIITKIDELLISKSIIDLMNLETDNIYSKSAGSQIVAKYIQRELGYDKRFLKESFLNLKFIGVDQNYNCFEAMSLPNTSLYNICFEKWNLEDEDICSSLLKHLQFNFLFIPIIKRKINGRYNNYRDWKIGELSFWCPSKEEILEIGEEWLEVQSIVQNGVNLEEVKYGNGFRTANNLIKQSESNYIHLRPHAKNKEDYDEQYFDYKDIKITKQSFWLNKNYVNSLLKNNKWKRS